MIMKIGINPALIAGPMMASLTDMVALGTYFTMARIVLKDIEYFYDNNGNICNRNKENK